MEVKGLDLSYHNSAVNFNDIVKAGYKFVILRIGYRGYGNGKIIKDTYFETFYTKAKLNNLDVGVYFFTQATNELEAIEEAEFVMKELNGRKLEYPIFIDQEWSNNNKNGRADYNSVDTNTKVISAFCKAIENYKYYAGFYSNPYWLDNKVNKTELAKYDKWIAKWSLFKPSSTRYESYGIWQNTNSLLVGNYRIDGNICYYDYPNIMIKNNLNGYCTNTKKYSITIPTIKEEYKEDIIELCDKNNILYIVKEI